MSRAAQNHLLDSFTRLRPPSRCSDLHCGLCCRHLLVHDDFSNCIQAALFILREFQAGAKSKCNQKQTWAGKTVGDKRGCACARGCGQLNAAGDQGAKLHARACVSLSVCVRQSVSWAAAAAAASPWLFSPQMSCAGMWVFVFVLLLFVLVLLSAFTFYWKTVDSDRNSRLICENFHLHMLWNVCHPELLRLLGNF